MQFHHPSHDCQSSLNNKSLECNFSAHNMIVNLHWIANNWSAIVYNDYYINVTGISLYRVQWSSHDCQSSLNANHWSTILCNDYYINVTGIELHINEYFPCPPFQSPWMTLLSFAHLLGLFFSPRSPSRFLSTKYIRTEKTERKGFLHSYHGTDKIDKNIA